MSNNPQSQIAGQQKSPTELLYDQTQSLSTLVDMQRVQNDQIVELQRQNERMIELLAAQKPAPGAAAEGVTRVKIENINMPFGAMVGFMIKIAFASIPAAIIIGLLYALVIAILTAIFGGLQFLQ